MNYQQFLSRLKEEIPSYFPSGCEIMIQQIRKNNDIVYDGLVIFREGINISPTIYLNPYYHRYLEGISMSDIYEDIASTYNYYLPDQNIDTTFFTDFSKASANIVIKLINIARNQELLKDVPYVTVFHDLAVVFEMLVEKPLEDAGMILIHNDHLKIWEVSVEELYETAMKNSPLLMPYTCMDIFSVISECMNLSEASDFCPDDYQNDLPKMYVISNRQKQFGASAVLYPGILKQLSKRLNSSLMLLPSSIHEFIAVPVASPAPLVHYSSLVRDVNETHLPDEEVLSDHCYYFDMDLGKVI